TPQLMTDIYYNDTQLAPILPLSLHDALPICTAAHSDIACIPRSWARWASTPTMPEGPSYSEASTPSSACTPGSSLVTWQGTGRVCGTSASRAPMLTTLLTPHCWATSRISSQKSSQRKEGSMPWTSSTVRPPTGEVATEIVVVGHFRTRVPSSSRTL